MSALGSPSPLFLASAAADAAGAGPIKSVRFNDDDSAYLNRTPSSAGNTKTWTWSGWVKYTVGTGDQGIFAGDSASSRTQFRFKSNQLDFVVEGATHRRTSAVFRDPSAWYHIVWAFDSTQSTASNRSRLYINGVEITDFGTNNAITQNATTGVNSTNAHAIGATSTVPNDLFDGYMADVYLIDGQQLDCTSFGAFDDNGVWQAAAYSGSYGTNGFHLFDFANESGIGDDSSGNDNDWTANNLSSSTGTIASPTRFDWETADTGWSLSDSNYTATNTTSGYRQVYSEALNSSTTYHFVLSEKPGDNNGGWFMSSNTSVNDTHPDELSGNTLGLRTNESGIGASGTFATANGVSSGQNAITGFSDIRATSGQFNHSEWVINMTARKVWVRSFGSSSWIKGGDPTNSSSTPSFSLPTGTIHFGYVAYSSNETQAKFVTSVPSVALGNDISFDVPTNGDQSDTGAGGEVSGNYATLNSNILGTYISSRSTVSNGNLKFVNTQYATLPSTIAISSGKWYCEGTLDALASASNQVWAGLLRTSAEKTAYEYFQGNAPEKGVHYWGDNTGLNRTQSYGVSYATAGTVIGIAFDADAGSCTWYVNGSSQGASTYNIVQGEEYFFSFGAYTNGAWTVNFGQRPFAYSAPSGYKALCTTNLPDPTIADGSTAFDVVLYTSSSGSGRTRTISGLNFSPDLVWSKRRSAVGRHVISDSVRGTNKELFPNRNDVERTSTDGLTAFTSDGYSSGPDNGAYGWSSDNATFVNWVWDAGSSTVSNTDGSITSQVRANQSAGFSIVTYTGNGTNGATVGHGLNAEPDFVITKNRTTANYWAVYPSALDGEHLRLNLTMGSEDEGNYWSSFSSSVMTLPGSGTSLNNVNNSSKNYVSYCWTSVENFSKFGKYMGNGSADGPFIYLGFRPALVIYKRADGTAGWYIHDYKREGYNPDNDLLYANYTNAEASSSNIDFLSNGFKIRTTGTVANGNNNEYVYAAWAKSPIQANGGLAR